MTGEYRRRLIDSVLDELVSGLPAIALTGARAVGKTATGSRRARTMISAEEASSREVLAADPDVITQWERPVFIDEWQLVPDVWNSVRRAVDNNPGVTGMFLLAGSATAHPDARLHSGAGRIVSLTLRPLSIQERQLETPTVSLRDLMVGGAEIIGKSALDLGDYVDEIRRSGFPGFRKLSDSARGRMLTSYLDRSVESDLVELGYGVKRPVALMAWLRAYAAATSSAASYDKILAAATPGDGDKPSRVTSTTYREHLTRLFLLDPLEAWIPTFSPLKRLAQKPKHHLVDPALAAHLAGVGREGLLLGRGERISTTTGSWLGALFESLAIQSIRVYADVVGARVGHLRTANGDREIDIVVEAPDHSCVAIEVKLASSISDDDVRHLHWLKQKLGDRLRDMVVVNTGSHAYRRPDGVAVVPLALLGH